MQQLTIVVNSSRHPDYVVQTARAAVGLGVEVKIHFRASGVLLFKHDILQQLPVQATISACEKSCDTFGVTASIADSIRLSPGASMADILNSCQRCVIY